jgi:hypothetical protein
MTELPLVVVDADGVLRFGGRTAEERLAALDTPGQHSISCVDRRASGISRAGRREGTWRFSLADEERFVVEFVDDRALSPPAGWIDHEWPRPSIEQHRREREVLEVMLREYRSPDDIGRIYERLLPDVGNSIPVVRGLMDALGASLVDAKMALDAACERAKRR